MSRKRSKSSIAWWAMGYRMVIHRAAPATISGVQLCVDCDDSVAVLEQPFNEGDLVGENWRHGLPIVGVGGHRILYHREWLTNDKGEVRCNSEAWRAWMIKTGGFNRIMREPTRHRLERAEKVRA